jgi:hypothetical protein
MGARRSLNDPQPGYWLMRMVKGGPRVPATICIVHTTREPGEESNLMDRSPFIAAFIAGDPVSIDDVWHRRGEPITESEYRFRVADLEYARRYAPDEPQAAPRKKIDLMQAKLPF